MIMGLRPVDAHHLGVPGNRVPNDFELGLMTLVPNMYKFIARPAQIGADLLTTNLALQHCKKNIAFQAM